MNKEILEKDYYQLPDFTILQVNDIIVEIPYIKSLNGRYMIIERITKKFCFTKYHKFPIMFEYTFKTIPKFKWDMTKYKAFRKKC